MSNEVGLQRIAKTEAAELQPMTLACQNDLCERCDGVSPVGHLDGFPAPECPHECHYRDGGVCSVCGGRKPFHRKPCYVVKGVLNPLGVVRNRREDLGR